MENSNRINPFLIRSVMEYFKENAPISVLRNLSSLSVNYNQLIRSTYYDKLNKTLHICKCNNFGILASAGSWIDCDKAEMVKITAKTLKPSLAPVFRNIKIDNFLENCDCRQNTSENQVFDISNLMQILSSFTPYITKLKFPRNYNLERDTANEISELIGILDNLKIIKFNLNHNDINITKNMSMIEKLKNPSTTIIYHYPISEGVTFENETFSLWVSKLKSFPNPIWFDFEFEDDWADVEELTPFILQYVDITRKIELTFNHFFYKTRTVDEDDDNYEIDNRNEYIEEVKRSISILSPYVTQLKIDYEEIRDVYRDIINPTLRFPKLEVLNISNDRQNLEFLKMCPNLIELSLYIDHDTEIFGDFAENIRDCFKHLVKLKNFRIYCDEEEKIKVRKYLNSIFPRDVTFELLTRY